MRVLVVDDEPRLAAAVQRGPNGTFVYVVQPDNTAKMSPVTVKQQDDVQTVIAEGVKPPDRLVTSGFARLTDGSQVTVSTGDGAPAEAAPPAVAPRAL